MASIVEDVVGKDVGSLVHAYTRHDVVPCFYGCSQRPDLTGMGTMRVTVRKRTEAEQFRVKEDGHVVYCGPHPQLFVVECCSSERGVAIQQNGVKIEHFYSKTVIRLKPNDTLGFCTHPWSTTRIFIQLFR